MPHRVSGFRRAAHRPSPVPVADEPAWDADASPSPQQDAEPTLWLEAPSPLAPREVSPALAAALRVARTPLVRHALRTEPIAEGIRQLFEIAAGRPDAVTEAIALTGKDPHFLTAAAIYYIEEVLWAPDASPHRVLGLTSGASFDRLADHLDVLLEWLLAPHAGEDRRPALARVRSAWQAIDSSAPGDGDMLAFASDRI